MENPQLHGAPPYRVAVVHGGPGAPGSVADLARDVAEMDSVGGVLEPLQTEPLLDGQVTELKSQIERTGAPPIALIGWSWGAWLALILAARYPELVRKLILIGSGPFDQRYVPEIMQTRLARLTAEERRRVNTARAILSGTSTGDKEAAFAEFGHLLSRADAFDPLPQAELAPPPHTPPGARGVSQSEIYARVWPAAARLRETGELLELAGTLQCPVIALHGDHDPHPAEGVREPLQRTVPNFRFILLNRCGHEPWRERQARSAFLTTLHRELQSATPP